ncbi:serine/threonine-protein kinase [Microbacterium sp. X-17]|uniref:serine/threonine-protein kinase n=1 Tax=Microbacterium sp. X-17 TaxID=3144404 RepID=UPI0031F5B40F
MASRLPAAPPVLAGFDYVRPLGTGGFADVYLFEQDMPRRAVAVKVLLQEIVAEGLLRMFNAEADVMARLSSHPSIVTIYQAGISADGRPFIVMEYCPTSMTSRYRRERIPVAEVLQLGVKIGSALETAHRAGLLHRDIKPSNILVTAFGAPVLSDFGIATSVTAHPDDEMLAMSVPWSAPEVVDERVAGSVPAEVWSLGATVYSLLAGRSPFELPGSGQNSRDQLRSRIRRAAYPPIGRDDVPPRLEETLRRALSRDPGARQASAAEFAYELQLAQHELGLPHTPMELATDAWVAPVDVADDRARGPARSSVPYASARPERAAERVRRSPGGTGFPDDEPRRPRWRARTVVLVVAGAVVVAAAVAVAIVVVAGGR